MLKTSKKKDTSTSWHIFICLLPYLYVLFEGTFSPFSGVSAHCLDICLLVRIKRSMHNWACQPYIEQEVVYTSQSCSFVVHVSERGAFTWGILLFNNNAGAWNCKEQVHLFNLIQFDRSDTSSIKKVSYVCPSAWIIVFGVFHHPPKFWSTVTALPPPPHKKKNKTSITKLLQGKSGKLTHPTKMNEHVQPKKVVIFKRKIVFHLAILLVTFLGWWKRDPFEGCWWKKSNSYH